MKLAVEETVLLLYLLLTENEGFKNYALSRTDPEGLLLPLLRIVYEAVDGKTNYSQVYVLLIVLLLFSQDEVFCKGIQNVMVPQPLWFTERILKNISLDGLIALVLIRTIQFNLIGHRDMYFHTNCLATLANMAGTFKGMHHYVAQRLISLFDIVSKRYQKLLKVQNQDSEEVNPEKETSPSPDLTIYGDLVVLILEILNSILTHSLSQNPQLVYALLHRKELFVPFRGDDRFRELVGNVEMVTEYFQTKLLESNAKSPSAAEISGLIERVSKTWPKNKLQKLAEPRFQYEEETESEEFFCPYVWSLAHRHGLVYWDEEKMQLLQDYQAAVERE